MKDRERLQRQIALMEAAIQLPMSTQACDACAGTGFTASTPPKALGAFMQARRKEAGLTLRVVSKRMGISVGYLSDIEHGRKGVAGRLVDWAKAIAEGQ